MFQLVKQKNITFDRSEFFNKLTIIYLSAFYISLRIEINEYKYLVPNMYGFVTKDWKIFP